MTLFQVEKWKVSTIRFTPKQLVTEDVNPENHPVGTTKPFDNSSELKKRDDYLAAFEAQVKRYESDGNVEMYKSEVVDELNNVPLISAQLLSEVEKGVDLKKTSTQEKVIGFERCWYF